MTNQELFAFIKASPTPYHAVHTVAARLREAGFSPLCESAEWALEPGRGYYVTRNASSLIAFRLPAGFPVGYMMTASHCDSPCFKVKENAELREEAYVRLSTEGYGGMLCASWLDRPLSLAGRVMLRTDTGAEMRLVDFETPEAVIPSVAIHMNRKANEGTAYNPAVDMLPLYSVGGAQKPLRERLAAKLSAKPEDILAADLFVYNPQPGAAWNGAISAPRLDDLQCAFGALRGFLAAAPSASAPVYCLFDNEEVGSGTKQGAASTFLADTLARIAAARGLDAAAQRRAIASSFLVSCDNAHAVHPNHPEYQDRNHAPRLNRGVVVKYNASQRYTSDAVSAAILRLVLERAGVPWQMYANRADMPGGSTLGNISNTQVSLNAVDIGLPQLAMHSAYETAGAEDTDHLIRALTLFYSQSLVMEADGRYRLE